MTGIDLAFLAFLILLLVPHTMGQHPLSDFYTLAFRMAGRIAMKRDPVAGSNLLDQEREGVDPT